VHVKQPPKFVDPAHPDFVFKLDKAFHGLKQALRVRYERLNSFLVNKGFVKVKVDTTLFTEYVNNDILIIQIYVDDIIFRFTIKSFARILNYA